MITTDRLRELVNYDPATGIMTWTGRGRIGKVGAKRFPGREVGSLHSRGYLETQIDGSRFYVHRLAWQYVYGSPPSDQVDHINGDRTDNRIANLRPANQQQQSANMVRRSRNKSGFKGVVRRNKTWLAYIHINRKTLYLGKYATPEEAHQAYLIVASKYFGEYANDGMGTTLTCKSERKDS